MTVLLETPAPVVVRREVVDRRSGSDRAFVATVRASALSTLAIMGLIGLFLTLGAWPALKQAGPSFFTEHRWLPETGHFGIASLLWGTVLIGMFALALAVPLGFGAALFIGEYAPRSIRGALITLVDLMAAVPAVIYAMWGFFWLQPHLLPVAEWISVHLGPVLPFLRVDEPDSLSSYTSSSFIAGMAVGVVILPTITSVTREVFSQAPVSEREGAIALGATKWGMIRTVVLPFGKAGMIGGTMLGLGRALGETIAVYMILSVVLGIQVHVLQSGGSTVSSLIALRYGEATKLGVSALMAAGLALFVLTL